MIVQLPVLVRWTVLPATVQPPFAVNVTGNVELAVAKTEKFGSPSILFASAANVMLWTVFATVNCCPSATLVDAYFVLPVYEACETVYEPAGSPGGGSVARPR